MTPLEENPKDRRGWWIARGLVAVAAVLAAGRALRVLGVAPVAGAVVFAGIVFATGWVLGAEWGVRKALAEAEPVIEDLLRKARK